MNTENNGIINLFITGVTSIIAWITLHDIQSYLSYLSAIIAIISGILAARYYWFAGKEKKLNIKKLEKKK